MPNECQEITCAVGPEMEPIHSRTPRRSAVDYCQDRKLRLAGRTTGPGRGLRDDLRRVGNRQVGGLADRCPTASDAARRGRRRRGADSVQGRRFLP